jgi:outer membrane protein TolC
MARPRRLIPLLLGLCAAALVPSLPAQTAAAEREAVMSLDACIMEALRNNLGVAIEVITPRLYEYNLGFTLEKYIPSLAFGFSSSSTSTPSFSWIDSATQVRSQDQNYSAQVSQFVPTGGRFYATLSSYKSESNRSFQTINPRYGSTLSFSLWQPLLRNFGVGLNKRDILVARNNLDISEIQFRSVLQDTIYRVEQAYWNLVYSIELLKVRRQSLELARDLLAKNKREAEVGTLPPIEILNAQAEVATREADILQSESLVASSQDSLLIILNMPAEAGRPKTGRLVPSDQPGFEKRDLDLEACLATALENRTDLQVSKIDLQNKELSFQYARNQLLPDLSLSASYWSPGISGTQIIYQDNNPLTNAIIGYVPSGARDSLRDAFGMKYDNWSISLSLSVPLNNYVTQAHYAQIKLSYDQAVLRIRNQEQQVFLEVKNAVRDVETNAKRVQAYKAARELSARRLQAEEKKLKVGLTTNYIVLWQQRDLATAIISEIKAMIDYSLSVSALERTLGTSLKTKNIRVGDVLGR